MWTVGGMSWTTTDLKIAAFFAGCNGFPRTPAWRFLPAYDELVAAVTGEPAGHRIVDGLLQKCFGLKTGRIGHSDWSQHPSDDVRSCLLINDRGLFPITNMTLSEMTGSREFPRISRPSPVTF